MAGCMVFVFAALAEFVVVKVLDVQYQQQAKQTPKPLLPLRLTSTMEKGQCQTVAVFDGHGTNVRSRKANSQTPTTPVQVQNNLCSPWVLALMFDSRFRRQTYTIRGTCKATEVTSRSIEGSQFSPCRGLTTTPASRKLCGARSISCRGSSFRGSSSSSWFFTGQFSFSKPVPS